MRAHYLSHQDPQSLLLIKTIVQGTAVSTCSHMRAIQASAAGSQAWEMGIRSLAGEDSEQLPPRDTLVSSAHSMVSQGRVQVKQRPYLGLRICRSHPPPARCRRADGGHEADCARSCCGSIHGPSCRWGPSHRSHSCSHTWGAQGDHR